MKSLTVVVYSAVVLAMLGAVGLCAEPVDIAIGETYNITIWGAENNLTFRVMDAVPNQTVNVRIVRRKPFYFSSSQMYLCPQDLEENCTNTSLWSYEYDSNGTSVTFVLIRNPHTYDTEVPVTIKVCNETCEPECPSDCDGAGGCNPYYHMCFCDSGFSLSAGSCIGESFTDGRIALIVCMCLLAVIIILVIVGLLFHFCEKKVPKPKAS